MPEFVTVGLILGREAIMQGDQHGITLAKRLLVWAPKEAVSLHTKHRCMILSLFGQNLQGSGRPIPWPIACLNPQMLIAFHNTC